MKNRGSWRTGSIEGRSGTIRTDCGKRRLADTQSHGSDWQETAGAEISFFLGPTRFFSRPAYSFRSARPHRVHQLPVVFCRAPLNAKPTLTTCSFKELSLSFLTSTAHPYLSVSNQNPAMAVSKKRAILFADMSNLFARGCSESWTKISTTDACSAAARRFAATAR